jgi:hypothetical protein
VSSFLRAIAAALITVLTGLPVAGIVCARECTAPHEETATPGSHDAAHCHENDAADVQVLSATGQQCNLYGLREVATRERSSAPRPSPQPIAVESSGSGAKPLPRRGDTWPLRSRVSLAGVSPGTMIPLRV